MSDKKIAGKREDEVVPKAAKKPEGGKDEMSMAKEDIADVSAWLSTSNLHEGIYDKTLATLDKGLGAVPDEELRDKMGKDSKSNAAIEAKPAASRKGVQKNTRGFKQDAQQRKHAKNYSKV